MIRQVRFFEAGFCRHPAGSVLPGEGLRSIKFPSSVAVIEHSKEGVILFDTGYTPRFYQATNRFPERIYALLTPVTIAEPTTIVKMLHSIGIKTEDVRKIIVSHFHADHIGGLKDFPSAEFIFLHSAYEALTGLGRWRRLLAGFLRDLMPVDFKDRGRPISIQEIGSAPTGLPVFDRGFDIFGDGSLVAISLPGHAPGHMGLLINLADRQIFLLGDAAWLTQSIDEQRLPSRIARLIMHDSKKYEQTLQGLHALKAEASSVILVPCHCVQQLNALGLASHLHSSLCGSC